jgi:hypothetical protein
VAGMSQRRQIRTSARLFNHLVGAEQNGCRQRHTQRARCLEVRYQLEARWAFDGQIGGCGTLQQLACHDTRLRIQLKQIRPVGYQAALMRGDVRDHIVSPQKRPRSLGQPVLHLDGAPHRDGAADSSSRQIRGRLRAGPTIYGGAQSAPADCRVWKMSSIRKSSLSCSFLLSWARTPLTIVVHRLPGRRVVIRPTLDAIGSIDARYHGADACSSIADVHRAAPDAAVAPHGQGRACNC